MTRPPREPPAASPFDEIARGLLWPRLLHAPALAGRPQRVGMALLLVLLVGVIGRASSLWHGADKPPFLDAVLGAAGNAAFHIWSGLIALNTDALASGFVGLVHDVPLLALRDYPLSTFVLGLPALLVAAAIGGSICRSVACEFAQEIIHPWPKALAFGIARWRSFFGVLLLPWFVVALVAALLGVAGWVCFGGLPGLDVLGGVLFGIALALSALAVLVLVLGAFGAPLLLPAAACEGSDAIDAGQRVIAYACARPLRLAIYLVVGAGIGVVAVGVLWAVTQGIDQFARGSLSAWAGPEGTRLLTGFYPSEHTLDAVGDPRTLGATGAAAAWLVGLWSSVLQLIVAGYAVSYCCSAGTLIYLFMREVCDGQHHAELWTPGVSGVAETKITEAGAADQTPGGEFE